MLAGIVFQVATFTFLYILLCVYNRNLRQNKHTMTHSQLSILHSKNFKVFAWGMFVSSTAIYFRCIYRIAELAGGWGNKIMQDEVSFYVLDGAMCVVAVLALTVAYPGIWFKPLLVEGGLEKEKVGSDLEVNGVVV